MGYGKGKGGRLPQPPLEVRGLVATWLSESTSDRENPTFVGKTHAAVRASSPL
jgi:hypothetical protein